jgi:hypothetical protein
VEFSSSAQSFSLDSRNVLAFPGSAQQFAAGNNAMAIDNFGYITSQAEHSGNYTHHITSQILHFPHTVHLPAPCSPYNKHQILP